MGALWSKTEKAKITSTANPAANGTTAEDDDAQAAMVEEAKQNTSVVNSPVNGAAAEDDGVPTTMGEADNTPVGKPVVNGLAAEDDGAQTTMHELEKISVVNGAAGDGTKARMFEVGNSSTVNSAVDETAVDVAHATLTAMDSKGGESSGSKVEKFPIKGKIYASVYAYESDPAKPSPDNVENAELMIQLFKDWNCEILSAGDLSSDEKEDDNKSGEYLTSDDDISDSEEQCTSRKPIKKLNEPKKHDELVIVNQRPKDTADHLKQIAKDNPDPFCFILYFILWQVGSKFKVHQNMDLDVFQLWKNIQRLSVPVIFFIQGKFSGDADIPSVLLNSSKKDGKSTTIAKSANVLLVYLPSPENLTMPVAEILRDELCKNLDIHTSLTNVIRKFNAMQCRPVPKFSSTLIKQLHLTEGDPVGAPEKYSCGKKYLAYAFLFGEYSPALRLCDLRFLIPNDEQSLRVLEEFGVELTFCVDKGKMTKAEFEMKLHEILQNDFDSYDGIFIIVSSHGWENLLLAAYDKWFTVDFIWQELTKCTKLKDKPKVVICDACRGGGFEERLEYTEKNYSKGDDSKALQTGGTISESHPHMVDVLIALAAVEGKPAYPGRVGSTFIYHLCQTLRTHGREDFQTILTITMNRVSLLETTYKQQVTFTSTLQKLLYLPVKQGQKRSELC